MGKQEVIAAVDRQAGREVAALPRPVDPGLMLQTAIERGLSAEAIEKLASIYERFQASESKRLFNVAMAAAQAEMPCVVRDKKNPQTNSDYASLESVQDRIKPVCTKHGFTISFGEGESPREGWVRVTALVRHIDGHSETYHRDGPIDNVGMKGTPNKTQLHGVAATATYLTRHLLCGIFSVTIAGMDKDGSGDGPKITDEQATDIRNWIAEAGRTEAKFLEHFHFASVESIPANRFASVLAAVKKAANDAAKAGKQ